MSALPPVAHACCPARLCGSSRHDWIPKRRRSTWRVRFATSGWCYPEPQRRNQTDNQRNPASISPTPRKRPHRLQPQEAIMKLRLVAFIALSTLRPFVSHGQPQSCSTSAFPGSCHSDCACHLTDGGRRLYATSCKRRPAGHSRSLSRLTSRQAAATERFVVNATLYQCGGIRPVLYQEYTGGPRFVMMSEGDLQAALAADAKNGPSAVIEGHRSRVPTPSVIIRFPKVADGRLEIETLNASATTSYNVQTLRANALLRSGQLLLERQ